MSRDRRLKRLYVSNTHFSIDKSTVSHEDSPLGENCLFLLPLSHSTPSLPIFPLEFRAEVNRQETRVMGLSYS